MLTHQSIDAFLNTLTINAASANTIRAYRIDLSSALPYAASATDWASTEVALARYLNDARLTLAPKTIERRLGTFRVWARWAGHPGLLANYRAPKPAPPQPHPIPEGIDGVVRMIASTRNPRHKALCALTGLMGLRVAEATSIKPDDFDLDNMLLRVRGKGDKLRYVPISDTAWKHLRSARNLAMKNGTTVVRLTPDGARRAITRHARKAGLSRHVSSHDMRATLATAAYELTHDLRAVQEILGHSDSKTTQVYTQVSQTAKRAAMEVA